MRYTRGRPVCYNGEPFALYDLGMQLKNRRQAVFLCATAFFDHFDTALYGFLAPALAPLFFGDAHPLLALIASYSVFAIGIICRPAGGILAYYTSHRWGVLRSLKVSLLCLTLALLCMALLPTKNQIGLLSPVLLVLVRGFLDVNIAWERSLTKLTLLDGVLPTATLTWSSLYEACSFVGLFFASLGAIWHVQSGISWRVLFLGGACFGFVSLFARIFSLSADIPKQMTEKSFLSLLGRTFVQETKSIVRIAPLAGFSYVTYALPFLLLPALMPLAIAMPWASLLNDTFWLFVLDLAFFLILGLCLKNAHPERVLPLAPFILGISVLPVSMCVPLTTWLPAVQLWVIFWGVFFAVVWVPGVRASLSTGPQQYFVFGFAKEVGSSLIGRNFTAISLACYGLTGKIWAALVPFTVLALGCAWMMRVRRPVSVVATLQDV